MPTVRFKGRVLPATRSVSLPFQPVFTWKMDDLESECTFRLQIENGSVLVDCNLSDFDIGTHLLPLFVRAHDIASVSTELTALTAGLGLMVVLDTFVDPAGDEIPLV